MDGPKWNMDWSGSLREIWDWAVRSGRRAKALVGVACSELMGVRYRFRRLFKLRVL